MNFTDSQHCQSRAHCFTCRRDAAWRKSVGAPEQCPIGVTDQTAKRRLGDIVEAVAKPIAKALGMQCLDEQANLKPQSPCAKRRDALNSIS